MAIDYYKDNKHKPWEEWLNFVRNIKPGKQGLVGIMESKGGPKEQYLFKISQYINYLINHESTIMMGLAELCSYCPHFCKYVGNITAKVDPRKGKKEDENLFEIEVKYPIEKEVLLCELVTRSCKFYNYIRTESGISENQLYSIVKQVLMSISLAQREKSFTHYDLHSNNIMMKTCNPDTVFLYVMDEDNQFAVPSLGNYPVIIDFGFSYIDNMEDGPLWASMGHTDIGFTSDRFDPFADPKLFLVTVSGEIKEKRNTKKSRKFRRIVRNIFHPLKIDWDCGWDNVEKKSAAEYVIRMLRKLNGGSKLFKEYDYYCIDLLQSLIVLPLEQQPYHKIDTSYRTFITEWLKIEDEISSHYYNLYILKGIIDSARSVRAAYMCLSTRKAALEQFRTDVRKRIDEISKFCVLKTFHYEKMLCSLYVLSRNIEGILYDIVDSRVKEKHLEYQKMPLVSCEQIYAAIDCNIPSPYRYNENTCVMVIDNIQKSQYMFHIPHAELANINEQHHLSRGTYLYDLVKTI